MSDLLAALSARLSRRAAPRSPPSSGDLQQIKLDAIDAAFPTDHAVDSVADLGGVWAVDAGYTFYALERHRPRRAVLVDDDIGSAVRQHAEAWPQLELIESSFGAPDLPQRLGDVGLLLLFDVLLHQVAPDWDEILARFAPRVGAMAIVNPMWTGGDTTVRLLDLGERRYLASVPPQDNHTEVFARLDEHNERRARPWRDVHDIWQWGITDRDLRARVAALGFELTHHVDAGSWRGLERFDSHAYVFVRRTSDDAAARS